MAPHASFSTADISAKARRDILYLLEGVRGKKNLVIERGLAGPLGLYVKFSTLQEYGVDRVFFLENDNVDSSQRNIVFLARGEKASVVLNIAEQIKRVRRSSQTDCEFSIFWIPRRTLLSDQLLEESGVLGEVNIAKYPLYFIPLAEDLLSLELDDAFKDLYLRKDPSPLFTSAKALMLIQEEHGLFPRITGKGDNAKRLADLLVRMRSEVSAASVSDDANTSSFGLTPSASLESLIIIDREVDFPTALLTQLTYEGLIDEIFGISSNQTEVDSSIVGGTPHPSVGSSASVSPPPSTSLKRKILLDSGTDTLYATLCDANFAVVGPLLNKVARRLQNTYDSRNSQKSTAELRAFVQALPGYQAEQASLKVHTNLAEEIIKHTRTEIFSRVLEVQQNIAAGADPSTQHDSIEELISRGVPLSIVLRLLCIESTMSAGIRSRELEKFKRAIIHAYGHQHLLTLSSLEKIGLLIPRSGVGFAGVGPRASMGTNYTMARRSLYLIRDEVNEAEPDDIAFVFSGYAPLSVRLTQLILQKSYISNLSNHHSHPVPVASSQTQGWRPYQDVLKHIRGATFDETQTGEDKAVKAKAMLHGSGGEKTVVIFFLGGITRAEAAALRFVAEQLKEDGRGRRVIIATTSIVNGDGIVAAATEPLTFSA